MTEASDRATLRRQRRWFVLAVGVLFLLGLVLPHVALREASGWGRSLLASALYFLNVQSGAFPGVDRGLLAFAFNVTYLGLALQQLGLLLGVATWWILAGEDLNRWLFRGLVIGGWMLTLSAPTVMLGWLLMSRAGAPALLGIAWLPALLSGVSVVVAARRARDRIDRSWYLAGPELM